MDKYNHTVYGVVTVTARFEGFWMAQTTSGIRCVYENQLTPITNPVAPPPPSNVIPIDEPPPAKPLTGVHVNTATYSQISRGLPMIGKIGARKIKARQENLEGKRYQDFEQFKAVNEDLIDDENGWNIIEPLLLFGEE